jgi:hypothetical protein
MLSLLLFLLMGTECVPPCHSREEGSADIFWVYCIISAILLCFVKKLLLIRPTFGVALYVFVAHCVVFTVLGCVVPHPHHTRLNSLTFHDISVTDQNETKI